MLGTAMRSFSSTTKSCLTGLFSPECPLAYGFLAYGFLAYGFLAS